MTLPFPNTLIPLLALAAATLATARVEIPFLPQGPAGSVETLVFQDGEVIAGGHFAGADDVPARCMAAWNGRNWSPLGPGLRGKVLPVLANTALLEGGRLYVCGNFDSAGTVAAPGKAVWDGRSWSSLGRENKDPCISLAALQGSIYALHAHEIDRKTVRAWNGQAWEDPLPDPPETPQKLVVHGGRLWASLFSDYGQPKETSRFAYWDDTGWTVPYGPIEGRAHRFGWAGEILYVETANVHAINFFRMKNGQWEQVGATRQNAGITMAMDEETVFRMSRDASAQLVYIEKLVGDSFQAVTTLPSNLTGVNGPEPFGHLRPNRGKLYFHGYFRAPAPINADNIMVFEGGTWKGLTRGIGPGPVFLSNVLASNGTNIFFGGEVNLFPDGNFSPLGALDGAAWNTLGQGVRNRSELGRSGDFSGIKAMAASGENAYVAGWRFGMNGGVKFNAARWDGRAWYSLGEAAPIIASDIAIDGSLVYLGGQSDPNFPLPLQGQGIAVWKGQAWEKVGLGLAGEVRKLAMGGSRLVAVGDFDRDSAGFPKQVAVWDGEKWSFPVPAKQGQRVHDAAYFQGEFYLSGNFLPDTLLDQEHKPSLARLSGTQLVPIIPGVPFERAAKLAAGPGHLFVSGFHPETGTKFIAAWDGASVWKLLDLESWDPTLTDMIVHRGALWISGMFTSLEGKPAKFYAAWDPESTARIPLRGAEDFRIPGAGMRMLRLPGGSPFPATTWKASTVDVSGRNTPSGARRRGFPK